MLVLLGLFLIATANGVFRTAHDAWSWWDAHENWREREYNRLDSLHSDFTLARFEQQLGAPLFARPSRNGRWIEYVFRGRDYWVQGIARKDSDSIAAYGVTSCASDFRPAFALPDGRRVRLHARQPWAP